MKPPIFRKQNQIKATFKYADGVKVYRLVKLVGAVFLEYTDRTNVNCPIDYKVRLNDCVSEAVLDEFVQYRGEITVTIT